MKVTICVATIRPDTVGDAIASIRRQSHEDWELVVVGQGAEAAIRPAVQAARDNDPRISYVHLDRKGLSIARNHVLAVAAGDIVAFTDDDCEAPVDWLAELVSAFTAAEIALVFGSLVAPGPEHGRSRIRVCPQFMASDLIYDPVASNRHAPPGWGAVGANFAVRREVAARIGEFDEHLGAGARFAAAEETDYMLRAESLGVRMVSTPKVIISHTHGYRYGWRAVYRHRRAYARGNGAVAAKHSLLQDDRGVSWLRHEVRTATIEPIRTVKPHLLPVRLLRLAFFMSAYRTCMREYTTHSRFGPGDVVSATLERRER